MARLEDGEFRRVMRHLRTFGMLLVSDSQLPSISRIVAGSPLRGSWWGNPKANLIYNVANRVAKNPDILELKLIKGKITYVHRTLWDAILSVATAREAWQMGKLSPVARSLFRLVAERGLVETHRIQTSIKADVRSLGIAARELETKLLVRGEDVHTEHGFHAKRLETWNKWARRIGFVPRKIALRKAKSLIEESVAKFAGISEAKELLPWYKT